jgi:hypothetical protein
MLFYSVERDRVEIFDVPIVIYQCMYVCVCVCVCVCINRAFFPLERKVPELILNDSLAGVVGGGGGVSCNETVSYAFF